MTDVIEDLEHILQRAIDCLTRLLNGLHRRLHLNQHRPLNRKNLVRWMSAFIPAPRDPRLRLQANLGPRDRWGSCGSLASAFSCASINQLVEENLGENIVRYRLEGNEDSDGDPFSDPSFFPLNTDCLTSTPKFSSSCSSLASNDPAATLKLAEMETELAMLRKQIASLVMAQELSVNKTVTGDEMPRNTSQAAAIPLPTSPGSVSSQNDSGCESESVPVRPLFSCVSDESQDITFVAPAPPPAPPPPPPLPPQFFRRSQSSPTALNFSEALLQRKTSLSSCNDLPALGKKDNKNGMPDMSDVLKDLGSVKLRAVQRSPGGTPLRRKPQPDPSDPASIIAQALKKKFANHRGFSPDSDKENDTNSFTSDTTSPFGQHLLKSTKRRLSLINGDSSDNWTPVASPLKERNV